MSTIHLGDVARDTITGFEGVVVARTEWLTGCARLTLQPKVKKDGTLPDSMTFDEPTCDLVTSNQPQPARTTGGPRPEPVKR